MTDPLTLLSASASERACGLEVGAHTLPVRMVTPYYVDKNFKFAGIESKIDVQADAATLPLANNDLDFLCSSHVLEHLANPIAALLEWWRVLRAGGLLYLVVPDKRYTFDSTRQLTSVDHFVSDFRNNAANADEAHLRDFIFGCDWKQIRMPPDPEGELVQRQKHFEMYTRQVESGETIDIHYHTFTARSLTDLLAAVGFTAGRRPLFTIRAQAEAYPPDRGDGIGILLEKLPRSSGEGQRTPSFEIAKPGDRRRPLRLFCPATLDPLELDGTQPEARSLVVRGREHRYRLEREIPALISPAHIPVTRDWSDPAWRERFLREA